MTLKKLSRATHRCATSLNKKELINHRAPLVQWSFYKYKCL